MSRPSPFLDYPASMRLPYGPFMGIIDRALDGDTVLVQLDPGWDENPTRAIRLSGVRAPESWELGADKVKAYVDELCPYGAPCIVYSERTPVSERQKRSFTRYIGEVILEGNRDLGLLVNARVKELLDAGEIDSLGY